MPVYFKGVDHNPVVHIPRMVTLADGTAYSGTPTEEISVDGAAFTGATNAASNLTDGDFSLALTTAEWATVDKHVKVALNDVLAVGGGQSVTIQVADPFDSYPNGYFVIDAGGVIGTDFGINGTPQNPCTTIADMRTMFTAADALGTAMKRCEITGVTPISLSAEDYDGWEFILGPNATLTVTSATTCEGLTIIGGTVIGTFDSASTVSVSNSILEGVTGHGTFSNCSLPQANAVTLSGTPNVFVDCYSTRADGSSPSIDMGGVNNASLRVTGYKGDLSIGGMDAADASVIEVDGTGHLTLLDAVAYLPNLTLVISGNMAFTDNSTSGVALTNDAQVLNSTVSDAVLTEVVSTHAAVSGSLAEVISDILTDTGTTIPATLGTPTDTDLATDLVNLDAVVDTVKAETVLILADTADMQPKLGTPAGASISADILTIDNEVGTVDTVVDGIATTLGTPTDTDIATDLVNLDALIDLILADTGTDGVVISAATANQIADALLNRDFTSVSDTNARTALNALRLLRNKWSVSGSTMTVTKENDTTSAWTSTVAGDAAADPIVSSDPA